MFSTIWALRSTYNSYNSVWYIQTRHTKVESMFLNFKVSSVISILPILLTCHVSYRSITCLQCNYFLQFWQGATNLVQSIFWNLCEMYQVWLLFLIFFCCSNANKINKQTKKHVHTKKFAIAAIFWEKCCISWQNGMGANIFVHSTFSEITRNFVHHPNASRAA